MARKPQGKPPMKLTAVYFTPDEREIIKKNAGRSLMSISSYLRNTVLESLNISK